MSIQCVFDWYNVAAPYGPIACAIGPYLETIRTLVFEENEYGTDGSAILSGRVIPGMNKRIQSGGHNIVVTRCSVARQRHGTVIISWIQTTDEAVNTTTTSLALYSLSDKARRNAENEDEERAEPTRGRRGKKKKAS